MRRLATYTFALALTAIPCAAHRPVQAADAPAARAPYDPHLTDKAYDWAKWSEFWSFRPVVKPSVPAAEAHANPIDAFVAEKLTEKGLKPTGPADKATLIRRATYDLTGLPPTPEEVRAFVADDAPDAYEKLIDRLLSSPHYGERWGRHWLDVARWTPGRVSFPGIKGTAGDSAYRDAVVRSFNNDKPYDRFLTEQLAGDLLPVPDAQTPAGRQAYFDQISLPAFVSIGAWFDQETDPNRLRLEMVDEQINATTKAFLALNIACARCHDHKTDPIPTQDYYALGGVFRSTRIVGDFSENWRDGRVRQLRPLALPNEVAANDAVRAKIDAVKADRWAKLKAKHAELSAAWKADEAKYRAAAATLAAPWVYAFEAENFDGQDNLRIAQLVRDGKGVEVLETQTPTSQFVRYRLEVPDTANYTLYALHSTDDRTPITVTANGDTLPDPALAEPTGGADLAYQRWDAVGTFELRTGVNFVRLIAAGGNFPRIDRLRLVKVDAAFDAKVAEVAAAQKLDAKLLTRFAIAPTDPWPTVADAEAFLPPADKAALATLTSEAEQSAARIKPYPLAVSVTDQATPVDLPVHLRGVTERTSAYDVPRGLPRFLDHALPRPTIPAGSSGRLELARWLTDPRHPLTSRVMVNRIWGWHFGKGLVDTPSDFGLTGNKPSHPELLDWLAATFVERGWSVKQMHRLIMTSDTYKRAGVAREPRGSAPGSNGAVASGGVVDASSIDPENRYLSHFPRRRLEAEELFDAMLTTTNNLVRQPAGQPLEVSKSNNRAMYILMTGRAPKGLGPDVRKMLGLFDADLSGAPVGARPTSSTPAQSLFWLNSPLVRYYADGFAARLLKMDKLSDAKRVEMAYLLAVGRPPGKAMGDAALAFIAQCEQDGDTKEQAWSKLCQAIYASGEFRYVD